MSKTEDYLDGLLHSVEGKNQEEEPIFAEEPIVTAEEVVSRDADQDFLDSFERQFLAGEDADEFIRQFERELDEEEGRFSASESDDFILDHINSVGEIDDIEDVDNIVAGVNEMPEEEGDAMDFMVDTLGDIPTADETPAETDIMVDDFSFPNDLDEPFSQMEDVADTKEEASDSLMGDDQDLMDLLQSEGDFSDIGDMFSDEEAGAKDLSGDLTGELEGFTLEEVPVDDTMVLAEDEAAVPEEKKSKASSSGFLNKLSQVLFGEDEEVKTAPEPVQAAAPTLSADIADMSEDDLALLQALEGGEDMAAEPEPAQVPETEEEAKARKKREKAEKKAQKKAEKKEKKELAKAEKAEKKAKKAKEKEQKKLAKKPKEPDNTPPLPKKPVILTLVMAGSFLALVLLGTNLVGYSSSMAEAEKQFGLGNYEVAYQEVAGLEIKEKDYGAYGKYRVMGTVAGEYSSYQTFMEAGLYDMALDSLVRAVGRCEKYLPEAEEYGCTGELAKVREQATGALASFGLTEAEALELYAMEERGDYSVEINAILAEAGFMVD